MKRIGKSILQQCYLGVRNTSIFARLLVAFLFVIILPSMFLINFIYKRIENEFYTTGINYIYQNLDVAGQKTYDKILDYEQLAKQLVDQSQVEKRIEQGAAKSELENLLYDMMEEEAFYNILMVSDKEYYRPVSGEGSIKGNPVVSLNKLRSSQVYKKSMSSGNTINWFNTKSQNDMYYGSDKKNSYLGNYVTMTYKITAKGETQALLVFNITVQKFSGLANISKLYGQDLFLADKNGILINLSNDFSYRNYPSSIWDDLYQNESTIYQISLSDKDTLFVTKKLGKNDWYVVSILKKEKLMKVSYDVRNIILIVVAVTTVISLIICALVTFSISYPLDRFKKAMSRFAKEDFYMEYEDTGKDQIAQASHIFQGMVNRIRILAANQVESQRQISMEQLKQKEMYVSALQMQINPHFLYNMLDLIRWNIVHLEKGNGRISRMMSGYSNLLRYNIKIGEGYATIAEELEHVEKYIKLLELLYEKEIDLKVMDNHISPEQYKIGKLFFQPVIENTIIHGKINTMEQPFIQIALYKKDNMLCIDILNNGKPISGEKAQEVNRQFQEEYSRQTSVGLLNVNQRIKLLFGEEYGMEIGEKEGLVCVTMTLPALEEYEGGA